MQTRFFTFPDIDTSFAMAQAAGLTHQDENNEPALTAYIQDYAIDVVGVISKPTGNMLEGEEGDIYPEYAPIPGWHVNVRILTDKDVPEEFLPFEVFPVTPQREFA